MIETSSDCSFLHKIKSGISITHFEEQVLLFLLCGEGLHEWISRRVAPDSLIVIIMMMSLNRKGILIAYGYFSSLCREIAVFWVGTVLKPWCPVTVMAVMAVLVLLMFVCPGMFAALLLLETAMA
jgi:hypothetical protein